MAGHGWHIQGCFGGHYEEIWAYLCGLNGIRYVAATSENGGEGNWSGVRVFSCGKTASAANLKCGIYFNPGASGDVVHRLSSTGNVGAGMIVAGNGLAGSGWQFESNTGEGPGGITAQLFLGEVGTVYSLKNCSVNHLMFAYPASYAGHGVYVDIADNCFLNGFWFSETTTGDDIHVTANAEGTVLAGYAPTSANGNITDSGIKTVMLGPNFIGGAALSVTGGIADGKVVPTYGNPVVINTALGSYFDIRVTNNSAFTISNPTNLPLAGGGWSRQITILIYNNSGGAMGTITWGDGSTDSYTMAGAFTNPANGTRRSVTFRYDAGFQRWFEIARNAADIG